MEGLAGADFRPAQSEPRSALGAAAAAAAATDSAAAAAAPQPGLFLQIVSPPSSSEDQVSPAPSMRPEEGALDLARSGAEATNGVSCAAPSASPLQVTPPSSPREAADPSLQLARPSGSPRSPLGGGAPSTDVVIETPPPNDVAEEPTSPRGGSGGQTSPWRGGRLSPSYACFTSSAAVSARKNNISDAMAAGQLLGMGGLPLEPAARVEGTSDATVATHVASELPPPADQPSPHAAASSLPSQPRGVPILGHPDVQAAAILAGAEAGLGVAAAAPVEGTGDVTPPTLAPVSLPPALAGDHNRQGAQNPMASGSQIACAQGSRDDGDTVSGQSSPPRLRRVAPLSRLCAQQQRHADLPASPRADLGDGTAPIADPVQNVTRASDEPCEGHSDTEDSPTRSRLTSDGQRAAGREESGRIPSGSQPLPRTRGLCDSGVNFVVGWQRAQARQQGGMSQPGPTSLRQARADARAAKITSGGASESPTRQRSLSPSAAAMGPRGAEGPTAAGRPQRPFRRGRVEDESFKVDSDGDVSPARPDMGSGEPSASDRDTAPWQPAGSAPAASPSLDPVAAPGERPPSPLPIRLDDCPARRTRSQAAALRQASSGLVPPPPASYLDG